MKRIKLKNVVSYNVRTPRVGNEQKDINKIVIKRKIKIPSPSPTKDSQQLLHSARSLRTKKGRLQTSVHSRVGGEKPLVSKMVKAIVPLT